MVDFEENIGTLTMARPVMLIGVAKATISVYEKPAGQGFPESD